VRLVSAVAMLLRRVRAERGVLALVFIVVAVTAFAVAAGPRLFERVASDGLRYEAAHATATQRNLQFSTVDRIPPDADDPFGRIAQTGAEFRERLPGSVGGLVDREHFVVEAPRFRLMQPPKYTTFVTFRGQDGLDRLVDLTAGRWPARVVPAADTDPAAPPVFEVAIAQATATTTGMKVGDKLAAQVDPGDPLLRTLFPRPTTQIEIVVSGLFTVRDPADPDWYDERGIDDATIGGTADAPIAYAVGLFAPEAYDEVLGLGFPARYRWNLFVDPDRLDARQLDTVVSDLRRLDTQYATTGATRAGFTLLRTGLLPIIDAYRTQRTTTEAAVTLAALGPLAVAAGAVALLGILVVRRRRPSLRLARGRGASGGQLLAAQLWEGLLITVPAAVVGLLLAEALVSGPANPVSAVGAIGVALGATLLLLLASVPVARRARRDLERDDPPVFRLSPRRLVFEVLIVGLSLAAVWLLRERGLSAVDNGGPTRGVDPFLAAAPMLVGLAVGLIIIRLYPIPVRGLGWLLALRRDLVPVLGLRSLGRHPSAGYLPLLILTLTVAIGTLSAVLQASLVRSQLAVSYQDVGADYRLESTNGGDLDPSLDPATVGGVQALARGLVVADASLSTAPGNRSNVTLEAIDPAGYDAVTAGTPIEQHLVSSLLGWPTGPDAGTAAAPIPAILSSRLPTGSPNIQVGDAMAVSIRGRTLRMQVVARSDAFPALRSSAFIVAPLESVIAGWRGTAPGPSVTYVRADASAAASLQAAAAQSGGVIVSSRHERYAELRDAPLVAAVVGGFLLALALAAAYAALAIVTVAALEAQRRSREVAFLRTLGLSDRQVALLTVVEQGAPLVLSLLIGIGVGLGLAWLVEPGLDLAAFSGAPVAVGLQVDWLTIVAVAVGVTSVVVVAVAGSSFVARRLEVGYALRIGEE
jgi:putative ABC transport system permease protein